VSKTKEEITAAVSSAYEVLATSFEDDEQMEWLVVARSKGSRRVSAAVHPRSTHDLVFCMIEIFNTAAQRPVHFRKALRAACLRLFAGETQAQDLVAFVENRETGERTPVDLKGGAKL